MGSEADVVKTVAVGVTFAAKLNELINRGALAQLAIFDVADEIRNMQYFAKLYEQTYKIAEDDTKFPDIFKLHHMSFRTWYGRSYPVVITHKKLYGTDLQASTFKDNSHDQITSENYELTRFPVSIGLGYIAKRENSMLHKKSIKSPYENVTQSRYYLIYFITRRLNDLSKLKISHDLIGEYKLLLTFVNDIAKNLHWLFPRSNKHGLHSYVREIANRIQKLINNTHYWLGRKSLSVTVQELNVMFSPYHVTLADYLLRCISSSNLGDNITLEHYKGNMFMLPAGAQTDIFFQMLTKAYSLDEISFQRELYSKSITLPCELSKLENVNHAQLVGSYKTMLKIFYSLVHGAKVLTYISEAIKVSVLVI